MRKKNIVLNGKKCQGNELLVIGDSVKLFFAEETIEKFSTNTVQKTKVDLEVIFENEDVIFINKKAGMLSQKAKKNDVSLVEHLITYLLNTGVLKEEDLKTFRPSICNRLDRNTTGLVTAGKSLKGLQVLSKYFKERSLEKYYLTIVFGRVNEPQYLQGYLIKNESTNKVKIVQENIENSEYIETSYKPIKSNGEFTLLEVHLITGKPHQIRAHLQSIGHPILGDTKYGKKEFNLKYKSLDIKHQLLHAYKLTFPMERNELSDLSGESFYAPLPKNFKEVLKEMGGLDEYLEL